MRIRRLAIAALLAAIGLWGLALGLHAQPIELPEGRGPVLLAAVEGPIGPAATRHIDAVLAEARERRAEAVILRLNTPGGLVTSTRDIVSSILASPVPVVGWVAPSGGHAASAGTFILYATHIAAMAPGTNIGAASPVSIGGGGGLPGGERENDTETKGSTLENKVMNDAVSFIRSLAELHGRNVDWAEKAVREAATLTAIQALDLKVIDIVASDQGALLAALDGRTVSSGNAERTLATADRSIEIIEPDTLTKVLAVLANPNLALILMLVGVYGLIFEFASPGTIGPGVIGAICLILGLYALNQLPLNTAGLALLLLGIVLMIAEAFTPTFGILGIGGVVAFLIGGGMLIDTDVPEFQLSWSVLIGAATVTGGFALLVLGHAWRVHHRPVHTGLDDMIGHPAKVLDWSGASGHVWLHGERWLARSDSPLAPGAKARVIALDGLTLTVEPLDDSAEAP